jgi:predicted HicB family RNase H-like nuclease
MNTKQRRTLEAIFRKPVPASLPWDDIEGLFAALGAEIAQREGSRIVVALNDASAVFHVPHPKRIAAQGRIRDVRKFLERARSGKTMKATMTYKGYTGEDVITFESERADEIEEAFHRSVDVYLDWCAERGKEPKKPFSGKLVLRIAPDVHRDAVIAATRNRKSLNTWLADVVARAAREEATMT